MIQVTERLLHAVWLRQLPPVAQKLRNLADGEQRSERLAARASAKRHRSVGDVLRLRVVHLFARGQPEVEQRRLVARQRVKIRQAGAAHGSRGGGDRNGVREIERRAETETQKTARIDAIPASVTAVVVNGR